MSEPLNPKLYDMLRRSFGEVKIANEGDAFCGRLIRDPVKQGRTKVVGDFGEYYCVCCPGCSDTRFRLWVNHRWGTRLRGERLTHLFVCYNEHCEDDNKFRHWFEERMTPYVARGMKSTIQVGKGTRREAAGLQAISIPESTPLHMLQEGHPVLKWLEGRDLDPQEMGAEFDVRWCDYSPRIPPFNKLIFPIYDYDTKREIQAYGFQARFFDPYDERAQPDKKASEVKWYTAPGTRVSKLLYNGWRCRKAPIVIITEGPLDVVRAGPEYAIATFGKDVSKKQQEMLWKYWGNRGAVGVLAFDHEAWVTSHNSRTAEKLRELEERMRGAWRAVVRIRFAPGEDPGSTPRDKLYEMIVEELVRSGNVTAEAMAELLKVTK